MTQPAQSRNQAHDLRSDDNFANGVTEGLARQIAATLKPLTNANRNRVLLALHAQIGEQLDSLAANNDQ